jgi:alpha-glucosidase
MRFSVTFLFSIRLLITSALAQSIEHIPLLPGENWWGGSVGVAEKMPFGSQNGSFDLITTNYDAQATPVLLSSKGRYLWSEAPFRCGIVNSQLTIESTAPIQTGQAGQTLRDAYLYAAQHWYSSDGRMPDEAFFSKPQWNTWIELGYNQNQASILAYARRILAEGFPPGILMLDDTWQEDYGTWTFSKARFPDPKAMVGELHRLGFKIMVWVIPCISPDSYNYRMLRDKHALLIEKKHSQTTQYVSWAQTDDQPAMIRWWNGVSAVLDLTKPAAFDWFKSELTALQRDYQIDGFKFDGGDWYFYPGYTTSPDHASIHAQKYAELGLDFPLNEYRVAWKMGGKPLVQRLQDKRHTWAETQQLIPHTLMQGLLGYPFSCPDMIGGGMFGSHEDGRFSQELYVRSAQVQALLPMMQFSMAPWRVLDSLHVAAVKRAVQLRQTAFEKLFVQLIRNYTRTNLPAVRSMEFVCPNEGFADVNDQYFIGDNVLVAPMLSAGTKRMVRLPKGTWLADDGQTYRGGQTITVNVPIDRIPYFKRI